MVLTMPFQGIQMALNATVTLHLPNSINGSNKSQDQAMSSTASDTASETDSEQYQHP